MRLTDIACRNLRPAEKPFKVSDGAGLFLYVQPLGSKLWRMAYRYENKQKTLSFGAYPNVSLRDARAKRDDAREMLFKGIDPGAVKKAQRRETKETAKDTFEEIAREWFDARRAGWTVGYAERLMRRLEADIFPNIGGRPIRLIEPLELLDCIRMVEKRGAVELAKRLLQNTGQIFRYAVASGRALRDPSQDLRGALRSPGPKKHRASLKASELPEFFSALDSYNGDRSTVLGIKLIAHTALRTQEIRYGRWSEIEGLEGELPLWRIPAERMKVRSEHLVPLSRQAVAMLRELKALAGESDLMFPARTKNGVVSQNTFIYAVYRLGYHSRMTVHGFRGTASTILNEQGFNRDWIERQLAHAERNDVRAAYNAAEWLDDRRKMLQWWSNYLDAVESDHRVVVLRRQI